MKRIIAEQKSIFLLMAKLLLMIESNVRLMVDLESRKAKQELADDIYKIIDKINESLTTLQAIEYVKEGK